MGAVLGWLYACGLSALILAKEYGIGGIDEAVVFAAAWAPLVCLAGAAWACWYGKSDHRRRSGQRGLELKAFGRLTHGDPSSTRPIERAESHGQRGIAPRPTT